MIISQVITLRRHPPLSEEVTAVGGPDKGGF